MQSDDDDLVEKARELKRARAELAPILERVTTLSEQLQRMAAIAPVIEGPVSRAIARGAAPKRLVGDAATANAVLIAIAEIGEDWIGSGEMCRYLLAQRPDLTEGGVKGALGRLAKANKIEADKSRGRPWLYRKVQSGVRRSAFADRITPANNGTHTGGAKRASRR